MDPASGWPAATALRVGSSTNHHIQSPACHPPSMLDFVMDGQKKCICSEAYLSYAGIWRDCTCGKVSILGADVLRVLSLSSKFDVSAYILDSAPRVSFANPENDYAHDGVGPVVSWRMFIVLLGLAHQLSGHDLDTFVRQFKFAPAQVVSVTESVSHATGRQLACHYSSSPQNPSPGDYHDTQEHNPTNKATPLISPKSTDFAAEELLSSEIQSGASIADGFQEYSAYFGSTQQTLPVSSTPAQANDRHKPLPFQWRDSDKVATSAPVDDPPVLGLGRNLPVETQGQASFRGEENLVDSELRSGHDTVSYYDGLIPTNYSQLEINTSTLQMPAYSALPLAATPADKELAPIPVETSQQPLGGPAMQTNPHTPDPRMAPILVEPRQNPEFEKAHSFADPKPDLIPVHSLQEGFSGLILDDDWQSVRHIALDSHNGLKLSSLIFEAEAPDVTSESRQVVENRLIALKDKEPSSKPREGRGLSIFGRKKASDVPKYSLSILATALEDAVKEGSLPIVATLMEFGADPNYRSKSPKIRHNALQYAATGGFAYMVDYLVHKGADSTAINNALVSAITRGHVDLAMRLVVTHRADVNAFKYLPVKHAQAPNITVGRVCANALAVAAFINNKNDRIRLVLFLLGQNCQIDNIIWYLFKTSENMEYGFGYSNLALFVPKCPESVSILLKAGIAAQIVRQEADAEVLKGFHEIGFSCENLSIIQAISRLQSTSWESSCSESLEIAAQLARRGANLNQLEFDGIEDPTRESGWKMTPLARVVKSGVIRGVKGLIELGANADSVITIDCPGYTQSRTLLHYAVKQGNIAVVQALISGGANVNRPSFIYDPQVFQKSESAMAAAASLGYLEIVRELLSAKADPNDGSLHKAARNAQLEVVKLLIQHGARLDIKIDSVVWPTLPEIDQKWTDNPDCNRIRRPRGDVLSFAMCWPGGRQNTSQAARDNYLNLVNLLLYYYGTRRLPVEQTVLRAALDANNIIGLKQLLNYPFKYQNSGIDVNHLVKHRGSDVRSQIFYISSQYGSIPSLTSSALKTAYGFTPVQYALMMQCDEAIIELLVSKGASATRLVYSSDDMDTLVAKGTGLAWEICRANRPVPKRVDGLEGAIEYVEHYKYGGAWRPVHITKIKSY